MKQYTTNCRDTKPETVSSCLQKSWPSRTVCPSKEGWGRQYPQAGCPKRWGTLHRKPFTHPSRDPALSPRGRKSTEPPKGTGGVGVKTLDFVCGIRMVRCCGWGEEQEETNKTPNSSMEELKPYTCCRDKSVLTIQVLLLSSSKYLMVFFPSSFY